MHTWIVSFYYAVAWMLVGLCFAHFHMVMVKIGYEQGIDKVQEELKPLVIKTYNDTIKNRHKTMVKIVLFWPGWLAGVPIGMLAQYLHQRRQRQK